MYSMYMKMYVSAPGTLWLRAYSEHAFKRILTINLCWSNCLQESTRYQVLLWQTSQPPRNTILYLLYETYCMMLCYATLYYSSWKVWWTQFFSRDLTVNKMDSRGMFCVMATVSDCFDITELSNPNIKYRYIRSAIFKSKSNFLAFFIKFKFS